LRRRDFIALLAFGVTSWPRCAEAQASGVPLIGFMSSRSSADSVVPVSSFRKGLEEQGFVEGQNITIEYGWASGHYDRLPGIAADFVRRKVAVLVAVGGEPSALAAKAATSTIPIVFTTGGDPVKAGLVSTMSHPGANATGVSLLTTTPEAKRLGLLHELLPNSSKVGILIDPNYQEAGAQERELEDASKRLGRQIVIVKAADPKELEAAFAALTEAGVAGLLTTSDPFFDTQRDRIIAFAAQRKIPAIYQFREYAVAGGLMSYGISLPDGYRQVGLYAGQILKGTKPADLPIIQSVKFEFVLNMKTANEIGVNIPPSFLGRADEVIE
jgi:putative ABC transport system substrate-binding protein